MAEIIVEQVITVTLGNGKKLQLTKQEAVSLHRKLDEALNLSQLQFTTHGQNRSILFGNAQ